MINEYYPLTQPQKRIWLTQKINGDSSMFVLGGSVTMKGEINIQTLQRAIERMLQSHDSFRIRIKEANGEPQQFFSDDPVKDTPFIDFTGAADTYTQWLAEYFGKPIPLSGPLYDFVIYRCPDGFSYGYLIRLHHMIADGWTIQLLTREVEGNYTAIEQGVQQEERGDSAGYREYIRDNLNYLKSDRYEKDRIYWQQVFSKEYMFEMFSKASVAGCRQTFFLPAERTRAIKEYCRKNGISINSFFVFVYIIYLNRTTGKKDIVIGTPVFGRTGRRERSTYGMFVSSMPFRYTVDTHMKVENMLPDINQKLHSCYSHHKYPYNHLVQDLNCENRRIYTDCVNYYNTALPTRFNGHPVINQELYNGEQEYDFQLIVRDWSEFEELQLDLDYKSDLYTQKEIERRFDALQQVMDFVVNKPGNSLLEISLVSDTERDKLYKGPVDMSIPPETVLSLFKEGVQKHADAIAVRDGTKTVTYQELDEKSDRLAEQLHAVGVGKNHIVALCFTHSVGTVIALIGVMKVGGTYLSLDPSIPQRRLKLILTDSCTEVFLTNIPDAFPSFIPYSIYWDGMDFRGLYETPAGMPHAASARYASAETMAYIIYTSGSTGQPKGVLITHGALYNYIQWACKQYTTGELEVFPLFTSLSVDLTVTSIFVPLCSGGTIQIYPDREVGHALYQILEENLCTVIKLTPSHMSLLLDGQYHNSSIHTFIVGGENLTASLAQRIYQNFGEDIRIYNEYGPTEATVGCMIYQYDPVCNVTGSVPIGMPIDHMQVVLVDSPICL